jgi:hypothetical protein
MADIKISDLTAMTAGAAATGDMLVIVDISEALDANKTKYVTLGNLMYYQAWSPSINYGGGSTDPTTTTVTRARYIRVGDLVSFYAVIDIVAGSGDRTYLTVSLPVTAAYINVAASANEGVSSATPVVAAGFMGTTSTVRVNFNSAMSLDGTVRVSGTYEAA